MFEGSTEQIPCVYCSALAPAALDAAEALPKPRSGWRPGATDMRGWAGRPHLCPECVEDEIFLMRVVDRSAL